MDFIKGQLVVLTYRESKKKNATWEYGVVEELFDGKISILRENGGRFLKTDSKRDIAENQPTNVLVESLTINGKPAMCAKNILGRYNFKPKKHKNTIEVTIK